MPPLSTPRQTPAGIKMDDGFRTLITFERDPDISFWEVGVKPSGYDGGEMIDTATMHSVKWRTRSPRKLITATDGTIRVRYDPNVNGQIRALINQEGSITCTYPDGTTEDFFGAMTKWEPDEIVEGQPPEATVTFGPTMQDPQTGAEADPVTTSVAGT